MSHLRGSQLSSPSLSRASDRERSKAESLLQWVNHVLSKHRDPIQIHDIGKDFRDGLVLAQLLSVLSRMEVGERLKRPSNQRPLQRFDCLGNLSSCFEFMRRLGVRLSNIGPEDLVTGNAKLTQGLIWTLMNFFLVEADDDGDVQLQGSPSDADAKKKMTPKQRLLEWVKVLVNSYPGVNVQSWKTGFCDGLALCALVHFHAPQELDYHSLDLSDSKGNMMHVFDVLGRRWGIPHLVSPDDLLSGRFDEDMLIALVGTCKKDLKTLPEAGSPLVSAREIVPEVEEEEANWESRKALRLVINCAKLGDRPGMDEAMATALQIFRTVLQSTQEAATKATAKRQGDIHGARQRLDRALRDLMTDAVLLCQNSDSPVSMRLVRRDVMALCAAEGELLRICADDADVSKKAMMERLRSLRVHKEPEQIMQASKQLEEENHRLTKAAKSKLQSRGARGEMDATNKKMAHLMIAELECMSPRFAPLAAKLASDPSNKETQRELAELNREITGIMEDLELTLKVDVSKQLRSLLQALEAALERVRSPSASLPSCQRIASNIGYSCQSALSSTRASCDKMPKHTSKPIMEAADSLDGDLSRLESECEVASRPLDLESPLVAMLESGRMLANRVATGEEEYRSESAVPEVRGSVSQVLLAIRSGDLDKADEGSKVLQDASNKAVSLANRKLADGALVSSSFSPEIVKAYISDLELLAPLHAEAVKNARANPKDRAALRRVAETARDILSVTSDLDEATRPPSLEDEFSSLQSLLGGEMGDLELLLENPSGGGDALIFDMFSDSRDVADAARQAVAEDPYAEDANSVLLMIQELEFALPAVIKGEENAVSNMAETLPTLEKAVRVRDDKRVKERREAPEDDLVRLGRYARAGADEEEISAVQEDASKKSKLWAAKKKDKTRNRADPIRQQRIMEAVSDLEAMAPLEMEAFSSFLEEPEMLVARDEFDDLSASVAGLDGLFPDLLLATPIDLDSAIGALMEGDHSLNAPPPSLRKIDLETLAPHRPVTALAPEMLQLDLLDVSVAQRSKEAFNAEPHAQRVVECLADGEDEDDVEVLEGEEFSAALDKLIAMLATLAASAEAIPTEEDGIKDAKKTVEVVDQACGVIAQGKRVAVSLPGEDDESSLLYVGLEDLANRTAEMVFAVQEHLDGADLENVVSTCKALAKQAKSMEQLAVSQALLVSVDTFELPTAESVLAEAHSRLDRAWQDDLPSRRPQPSPANLKELQDLSRAAVKEWSWDRFLEVCVLVLEGTHSTVPLIQDSGRKVLLRQAGEALVGRAKQLLWTTVHKPEEIDLGISAMLDACEALIASCKMLDAKAFRPVRTIENTPDAARIHNALVEGVSMSPKEGELVKRISSLQGYIAPISTELRSFKALPRSFLPKTFVNILVDILVDSGIICRGLEDEGTRNLLQGLREQVAETGTAFYFCALDVAEYPGLDSEEDSFMSLKRLSLALLQVSKWTSQAVEALQPRRSVDADPDTSRIMRQLKVMQTVQEEPVSSVGRGDLTVVHGLIIGFGEALASSERVLKGRTSDLDPSGISDVVVHVIMAVGALARNFGHDAHVHQICGVAELFGRVTCELIFRVKDLAFPSGQVGLVDESVQEGSILIERMLANASALTAKLGKLKELRSLAETLEKCEKLLGEPLPPPRVFSLAEFERNARRDLATALQLCSKVDSSFDIGGFSGALVTCAGTIRNNTSILSEVGAKETLVRLTTLMITAGISALRVLELAATSEVSSDSYSMANIRLEEEVRSVVLCGRKLDDAIVSACASEASATHSSSSPAAGSPSLQSSNPTLLLPAAPGAVSGPASPGEGRQARQTLLVGKAVSVAIGELSKKQTAVFSSSDEMPSGLNGSLELLEPTEKRIHLLLRTQKPGPELQRALLYFLNLLKHLASGYLRNDPKDKLSELVRLCKEWATKVIGAMQSMEVSNQPNVGPEMDAMKRLHIYVTRTVVLSCAVCNKAISGSYTTADGMHLHDSCFVCSTCRKPITGRYFRHPVDGRIFCTDDIPMSNNMVCARCNEPIELGTNYLECKNDTYHRECFSCYDCGVPLLASRFFLRQTDGRDEIVCESHA